MAQVLGTVLFVLAWVCVAANAFEVVAKLAGARFVRRNSEEVGVPWRWIPALAAVEGAGTAGLIAGLVWWPGLGLAAAIGLVLFFVGAVGAHVRARVLHNIAFPGTFLLLAIAACGYFAGRLG